MLEVEGAEVVEVQTDKFIAVVLFVEKHSPDIPCHLPKVIFQIVDPLIHLREHLAARCGKQTIDHGVDKGLDVDKTLEFLGWFDLVLCAVDVVHIDFLHL